MLKLLIATLLSFPLVSLAQTEEACLSTAIFYEAGAEPIEGQRAVMQVILNRARKSHKNVCAIVSENGQFSWYGKKPMKEFDEQMQKLLVRVKRAKVLISEKTYLWFFNIDVKPKWACNMFCVQVNNHYFCREV